MLRIGLEIHFQHFGIIRQCFGLQKQILGWGIWYYSSLIWYCNALGWAGAFGIVWAGFGFGGGGFLFYI
jgi:hypothetical protein